MEDEEFYTLLSAHEWGYIVYIPEMKEGYNMNTTTFTSDGREWER